MNTKEGYLINFEVYQGERFVGNEKDERAFGKAAAPFVAMLRDLPHKNLPYEFYLDNLLTSIQLFNFLRINGYSGTGTIRDNRIPKQCPLKSKAELKKTPRGTFDHCIAKDVGIILARWVDNSIVTAASTSYGVQPTCNVKRYSQTDKKVIEVSRPNLIGQYDNFMGGTDQMDENLGRYRISIRGKKWWWCIFTWMIDVAIINAWILRRKSMGVHSEQLSFRRDIAQTYLHKYGVMPKVGGRPPSFSKNMSLSLIVNSQFLRQLNFIRV
nr:piggyBac transposable element-derived protein 3-like [Leptinotarsa decemlineata]